MTRKRVYRRRGVVKQKKLPGGNYLRIVLLSLVIVAFSSCYIYLRVWVRDLDDEIKVLRDKNEHAERYLASLKTEWATASSLTGLEQSLDEFKITMRPTVPTQNLVIRPELREDDSRYAGLFKALDKLTGNIPVVSSSEVEANQLFEGK